MFLGAQLPIRDPPLRSMMLGTTISAEVFLIGFRIILP